MVLLSGCDIKIPNDCQIYPLVLDGKTESGEPMIVIGIDCKDWSRFDNYEKIKDRLK
mgnify:CR=1 FL=1